MDNAIFSALVKQSMSLHEDMLSLLRNAAANKQDKDKLAASTPAPAPQSSDAVEPVIQQNAAPAPQQINTADMNAEITQPVSNDALNHQTANSVSLADKLYNDLAPQAILANSIVTSVYNAFVNNCNNSKRMSDFFDQVKSWEKSIRGACEQVVAAVEATNFRTTDTSSCSPKAYKTIVNHNSRDRSAIDLAAAIIIFRNSLKR